MIYLDSAATTLQKPPSVRRAVCRAMENCGNPGRSGHRAAMRAANVVFDCREAVADYFYLTDPQRVVFTCNATHALNIAIKSCLQGGGHTVISGYEHNSVVRPLETLKKKCGTTYTAVHTPLFQPEMLLQAIEQAILPETRCIIMTHISNVFGYVLPVAEIDDLCRKRDLYLILDASQSAGVLPLDVSQLSSLAFVCMPGHKSLYGPQGTGILLCCKDIELCTVTEGGTGSESFSLIQPEYLPDALESGTLNVPGIAGLREGLRFVAAHGEEIGKREGLLADETADALSEIPGCAVWRQWGMCGGVFSFRCDWADPEILCSQLAEQGFCLRAGLHCAPLAHNSAGTLPSGTIRASFSAFNTREEGRRLVCAIEKMRKTAETAKNKCFRY